MIMKQTLLVVIDITEDSILEKVVILKGGDFVASLFAVTPSMCVGIVVALCFCNVVVWFVSFLACQSC